jgi:hypothetical protein
MKISFEGTLRQIIDRMKQVIGEVEGDIPYSIEQPQAEPKREDPDIILIMKQFSMPVIVEPDGDRFNIRLPGKVDRGTFDTFNHEAKRIGARWNGERDFEKSRKVLHRGRIDDL